jgi:hypothetical protein
MADKETPKTGSAIDFRDLRFFLTSDVRSGLDFGYLELLSTEKETIEHAETICRAEGHIVGGYPLDLTPEKALNIFRHSEPREHCILTSNPLLYKELTGTHVEIHLYDPASESVPYERLRALIRTRMGLI